MKSRKETDLIWTTVVGSDWNLTNHWERTFHHNPIIASCELRICEKQQLATLARYSQSRNARWNSNQTTKLIRCGATCHWIHSACQPHSTPSGYWPGKKNYIQWWWQVFILLLSSSYCLLLRTMAGESAEDDQCGNVHRL